MKKQKKLIIIIIIVSLIIIIDQISKILVIKNVEDNMRLFFLSIEKTTNEGMALGFNSGNLRNIFMSIFVIGIIINFIIKQIDQIDIKTSVAIGLILGGGISNLIDRIIRSGVFDFIKVKDYFTCNIADVSVFVGWVLLIVFIFFYTSTKNKIVEEKEG